MYVHKNNVFLQSALRFDSEVGVIGSYLIWITHVIIALARYEHSPQHASHVAQTHFNPRGQVIQRTKVSRTKSASDGNIRDGGYCEKLC